MLGTTGHVWFAAVVVIAYALAGRASADAVECYQETTLTYKGKPSVKVHLAAPTLVARATKEESWGRFQFPGISRWEDGTLCVTYGASADAIESYGSPRACVVSRDGGKTYTPHSGAWGVCGFLLPNGDRIGVVTPKAYNVAELDLPKPVAEIGGAYGASKQILYRLTELQPKLRTVRISRLRKGETQPVTEHSALIDPQALRYSLRGLFPIVWWGNLRLAPDGSVLAGIYPGFWVRPDGSLDPKGAVFFYRSTDSGHSWYIQGRITYQPNLKADEKGAERHGFTEPTFEVLADGSLLCVMRTTDALGIGPMYASRSTDLGKTWSKPAAISPSGVLPQLLRLENGILVLSSGRPGVQLRFCTDGKGKRWTDPFELVPVTESDPHKDTCGYTSLLATGPDRFLIAYSHFKHTDESGQARKAILIREVRISR